jgi:60 kDa SS-A/Ro ribonucleoprotein
MAIRAWLEQRDDRCPDCSSLLADPVDTTDFDVYCTSGGCGWRGKRHQLRGVDFLAYQMVKYRQRNGWTWARLIHLSHPVPPTEEHENLYRWALGRNPLLVPEKIEGFQWAQLSASPADTAKLVRERPWLPREALRPEHTKDVEVWRALLDTKMPMGALVRNLGRMTSYGVLKPMDPYISTVTAQLTNRRALNNARVHPIEILKALTTYRAGRGERLTWKPVSAISDALDEAFYAAFGSVEPSGKRTLLSIDVSGSMAAAPVSGLANLSARTAAAAMALVTASVEPLHEIMAFSSDHPVQASRSWTSLPGCEVYERDEWARWCMAPLDISPRMRLADAAKVMHDTQAGGTDLSLPLRYATEQELPIDTFVVYTDNEGWTGRIHPSQALKQYRAESGIPARMVIVAMTATSWSVADPKDTGMLDVVGFDTAAPNLISAFSRGEV